MLLEGWALPTCNMPARHALLTGSILNKHTSRADNLWGQKWSQLPDSLKIYAITDIKHLTWCTAVGCILRDLFPNPNAILLLTRVSQKEFVAEFNALLQVLGGYRDTDGGLDVGPDKGGCSEMHPLQKEGWDPRPLTSRQVHDVDGIGVPLG